MSTYVEKMPKQVRAQVEAAEKIEAAIAAETPEPEVPAEPAPEPAPKPAAPAAETPAPKSDDWEQKYKTLQGMLNAQKAETEAGMRSMRSELVKAQAKLEGLSTQAAAPTPTPAAPAKSLYNDADTELFGTDVLDLVERVARSAVAEYAGTQQVEIARLKADNEDLGKRVGSVSETQADQVRRDYFNGLAAALPEFETINVDPGFTAWLAEIDPLTSLPRQAYLQTAWDAFDVNRTVTIFKTYMATVTPTEPAADPAPSPLERQVQPNKSSASPALQANAATKIWTSKEVRDFYADITKGKYRGKDDDRVRIEAEIDAAAADGRVQP